MTLTQPKNGFLKRFGIPSHWSPPQGRNQSLEAFIHLTKQLVLYHKQPRMHHQNISPTERRALKELQTNPKIDIKAADKGSAIVILNSDDYKKEALRQLSDDKFYIKVPLDLTNTKPPSLLCYTSYMEKAKFLTKSSNPYTH